MIVSQAVLIAIGIDWDGRRQISASELANAGHSGWSSFLQGLKARGLNGVELVVSDDHARLRAAIREVLPQAIWQRCYVHFLRNALDLIPRKVDDDCLQELRWLYARRDLAEALNDLATWLARWTGKYPRLAAWVEENLEETLSFSTPRQAQSTSQEHQHARTFKTEEIKRRTRWVRDLSPTQAACV